jgi:hypothetical protein
VHRWLLQSPKEEPWNNIRPNISSDEMGMVGQGVLEIENCCSLAIATHGSVRASEKEK